MKGNARDAAFAALERCRKCGAWSAASLDTGIKRFELDSREAALASRLFLGVLQNETYLDYYLLPLCTKKPEPPLLQILRLGAYQLLFLDKIPAHAAVSESVELCRRVGLSRAGGMVNAVLRKMNELASSLPPVEEADTERRLAVRYSHPQWLVRRLLAEHEADFVEAFLAANNQEAPLCLQVNTLKTTAAAYSRLLDDASIPWLETAISGCFLLRGGAVEQLPGYRDGLFYVQDLAARAAVEAAGLKPGYRVMDACAAPGGKSFSAAMAMRGEGEILSCDISEKKLLRLREGAERLGISIIRTLCRDGRESSDDWAGAFDAVLADVPCSGLGVIRKRPEIRRKEEAELADLPSIQLALLENLSSFVKPGGVLLYSTCTVLQCENDAVIDSFLQSHPDFTAEDFQVGDFISQKGRYSFWPQSDGTDGFFAAKLRRNTI